MCATKKLFRLPRWALNVLGGISMVYLVSWQFASGGQTFFSPQTLETYWQDEILLPFVNLPIYRSRLHQFRYPLVDFLIEEGFWKPEDSRSKPLILTQKWNHQWRDGHSDFHRQFAWQADQWINLTVDKPEIAKLLWPAVLSLIRIDSEYALSNAEILLFHARMSSNVEEFVRLVNSDEELSVFGLLTNNDPAVGS